MTAIDDDSEDVKASEGKHVESRGKPEPRESCTGTANSGTPRH
jgi:hypothetical protein